MKKLFIVSLLISSILFSDLYAQKNRSTYKPKKTYDYSDRVSIGIGIGDGIFAPTEVGNYMDYYYSNYRFDFGSPAITNHYDVSLHLDYRLNNYFEFGFVGEADFGLKYITTNVDNKTFLYNRYLFGIMANAHLPVGSTNRNSIFIGLGPIYNMMNFEEYDGSSMGLRVHAGFCMNFGTFNPRAFIGYDIATADAKLKSGKDPYYTFPITTLSYSTFVMGITFNFSLTGAAEAF